MNCSAEQRLRLLFGGKRISCDYCLPNVITLACALPDTEQFRDKVFAALRRLLIDPAAREMRHDCSLNYIRVTACRTGHYMRMRFQIETYYDPAVSKVVLTSSRQACLLFKAFAPDIHDAPADLRAQGAEVA